MQTKQQTSGEYFKAMQIVYYALIAGQVIFGLISLFLSRVEGIVYGGNEIRNILIYILPVVAFGGISGSFILFRNGLKAAKEKSSLIEKLNEYRSALIVRYALLEAPSFFGIIFYLLTSDIIFLGISGLIILYFLAIKPTKSKAIIDLELNPDDEHLINNPEGVIDEMFIRP